MKKSAFFFLLVASLFCWSACQDSTSSKETSTDSPKDKPPNEMAIVEAPVNLNEHFYKRLEGNTASNESLTLHLIRKERGLNGNYFFHQTGQTIPFTTQSSINSSNEIMITGDFETHGIKNPTAQLERIKGKFVNNEAIKGTCTKPSKANESVILQEKYPAGTTPLDIKHFLKKGGEDCKKAVCLKFDMIYPHISSSKVSKRLRETFNDTIQNHLLRYVKDWVPEDKMTKATTIEQAANFAIADIIQTANEEGDRFFATGTWSIEVRPQIWTNDNNILSTSLSTFSYMGGPHPNQFKSFINYDLQKGVPLQLSDILVNYEEKLKKLVITDLKVQNDAALSKDLKDIGFFVSDEEFKLTKNFYITPNGLHFYYNTYEIASYAQGDFSVFIPFTRINNLIKPDGSLTGYAKY